MAGAPQWVDVELTPEEQAAMGTSFYKFDQGIGQEFIGKLIGTRAATGKFAKAGDLEYIFRVKEGDAVVEKVLSSLKDLDAKLRKAAPKPGDLVRAKHVNDQDTGQSSPMKVFKVQIARAAASTAPAAPKPPPPPKPAPAPEADPFGDDIPY